MILLGLHGTCESMHDKYRLIRVALPVEASQQLRLFVGVVLKNSSSQPICSSGVLVVFRGARLAAPASEYVLSHLMHLVHGAHRCVLMRNCEHVAAVFLRISASVVQESSPSYLNWLLSALSKGVAMQVLCKCKPSLFAYPPPVTQEAAAAAAKVPTAVLSTTARARDKAKKKEKKKAEAAPAAPASAPGAPISPAWLPARVRGRRTCLAVR